MGNSKAIDMTKGSIVKDILIFALPIFIGNLFQQFYNIVDTAVIGNVLGDTALASLGAATPLFNLIIGFSIGFTNGFAVIIARFFGAKDETSLNRAITLTYAITLALSVTLTVLSLIFTVPILKLLNTPQGIIGDTAKYLTIIFAGSIITMFYNMYAAVMRAFGNSRQPLYFLIAATFVNVGLDILFVKYMNMGVMGAAVATVIAQSVSLALCVIYAKHGSMNIMPHKKYLVFDKYILNELLTTGLSMALMNAVVAIGSVILQEAVNLLGADVVAAHTASRKIFETFDLPNSTLAMSAATFVSQNYGAKKYDRVRKGIKYTILISIIWAVFSCASVYIAGKQIITLLTGTANKVVIDNAEMYLHINFPFFVVLAALLILKSSLQGIGHKVIPISTSAIELVVKIFATAIVVPMFGYLGVAWVEPIIWCMCDVILIFDYIFAIKKFNKHSNITEYKTKQIARA